MSDVKFTGSSDFGKVKKDYDDLARRTARLEAENKKLNATAEKQSKAYGRARKEAGGLMTSLQGFLGIASTAGMVTSVVDQLGKALQFAKEESDKAKQSLTEWEDPASRLLQISTSAKDFDSLIAKADAASKKYGVDRQQAMRVLFSARSEGWEGSYEKLLAGRQVLGDVEAGATVAGQIPGLFPTANVKPMEAVNMVLKAAQQSRLDFAEVASAAPMISQGAALAGSSPEETLALAAVMASRTKSGKQSADLGKAFGTRVGITPELQGLGIVGAFKKLRDEFSAEQRGEFLGESQELNVFYQLMQEELGRVETQTGLIAQARASTGTRGSVIQQRMGWAAKNERMAALMAQQQARQELDIGREGQFGASAAEREAAINRARAAQQGGGLAERFWGGRAGQAAEMLQLDADLAGMAVTAAGEAGTTRSAATAVAQSVGGAGAGSVFGALISATHKLIGSNERQTKEVKRLAGRSGANAARADAAISIE